MCVCSVGLVIIPFTVYHIFTMCLCLDAWFSLNPVSFNESLCVCLASVLPPTLVWLLLGVQ